MTVIVPALNNQYAFYAAKKGRALAAQKVGRGQLQGTFLAMVIYCLCTCDRRVGRINERRLFELYLKQRAGLLSAPDPTRLRVHLKPFRVWVLNNAHRAPITRADLRQDEHDRHMRLIMDYVQHGPHFHNPDHRAVWERAQCP